MLNLIAGLETPTDGCITVDGEAIEGLSDDQLAVMRRKHIGIVFQFFNLLEGMSVLANVSLADGRRRPVPQAGGVPGP